ncbi:MAG: helix-turn-helix transcriptional regulator [Lachnospiraceae bacterium]|nr:helix-turn-helix transcriptional regulator [Lachnospiraceae bacterium]
MGKVHDFISGYQVVRARIIPANTFTDWKTGRSNPKIDKLKKLADYFNVSIEYFLKEEGESEAFRG